LAPLSLYSSDRDGSPSTGDAAFWEARAGGGFGLITVASTFITEEGRDTKLDRDPRGRKESRALCLGPYAQEGARGEGSGRGCGQIGLSGDHQLVGFTRLAAAARRHGVAVVVELSHSAECVGGVVEAALSGGRREGGGEGGGEGGDEGGDEGKEGADAADDAPIHALVAAFVGAAKRAAAAGLQGVELHCTHGDALCCLLNPALNRRQDQWGGPGLRGRASTLVEAVRAVRAATPEGFLVSVRLSPVPYKRDPLGEADVLTVAGWLAETGDVDYIDLSLQSQTFKSNVVARFANRLKGTPTKLAVCGSVTTAADAAALLALGADIVAVARVAIGNPDWANRVLATTTVKPGSTANAKSAIAGVADTYRPRPPPWTASMLREASVPEPFLAWLGGSRQHSLLVGDRLARPVTPALNRTFASGDGGRYVLAFPQSEHVVGWAHDDGQSQQRRNVRRRRLLVVSVVVAATLVGGHAWWRGKR
jgi:2,4-dienoyl-CoA reductase-like NADH-dependent reductase (Old Yellow Enzyme family)